jgi:predicted ArsR family transcriptional regulator
VLHSQTWTAQFDALVRGAARRARKSAMPPGARVAADAADRNRSEILSLVQRIGDLSIKDICDRISLSRKTVAAHLVALENDGLVKRGAGKRWSVELTGASRNGEASSPQSGRG